MSDFYLIIIVLQFEWRTAPTTISVWQCTFDSNTKMYIELCTPTESLINVYYYYYYKAFKKQNTKYLMLYYEYLSAIGFACAVECRWAKLHWAESHWADWHIIRIAVGEKFGQLPSLHPCRGGSGWQIIYYELTYEHIQLSWSVKHVGVFRRNE